MDGIVDPNAGQGGNPGPGQGQENQKPPMGEGNQPGDQGGEQGEGGMGFVSVNPPTGDAWLNVSLPREAKVYVNGRLTSTPGGKRQYVSRNLIAGEKYTYEVRAEVERDGKKVEQTKVVSLTAGSNKNLDFDFGETRELITSLTLSVPADAKVSLGDVQTSSVGPVRYYSTKELKKGEAWKDYKVVVSVNRNGKTVSQEKTVTVAAGQSMQLNFDFESNLPAPKIASRNP